MNPVINWLHNDHHEYQFQTFNELFQTYQDFYLPNYQRRFVWDKNQFLLLLETFNEFIYSGQSSIWLGVLLLYRKENKVWIIDGQQRISTIGWLLWKEQLLQTKIKVVRDEKYRYKIDQLPFNKFQSVDDMFSAEWSKWKKTQKLGIVHDLLKKIWVSIIWIKKPKYEYFKNLNSKSMHLTLAEQCIDFLSVDDEPFYFQNFNNLFWLQDETKKTNIKASDLKKDGTPFFNFFIKAYCSRSSNQNYLISFKKFIKDSNLKWWRYDQDDLNNRPKSFFYKFLAATWSFFNTESYYFDTFEWSIVKYVREISCQNFWWWCVELMLLKDRQLIKVFSTKIVWLDLGKALTNFKQSFSKTSSLSFLQLDSSDKQLIFQVFADKYIVWPSFLNIDQINDSIQKGGVSNRIKLVIFLVNYYIAHYLHGNQMRETARRKSFLGWLQNNFLSDFFRDYHKYEIEHLVAQRFQTTSEVSNEIKERVNTFENLMLLKKEVNASLSDERITYKIEVLFGTEPKSQLNRQDQKLFSNVLKIWEKCHNEVFNEYDRILTFWRERKKLLANALLEIKKIIFEAGLIGPNINYELKLSLKDKKFQSIEGNVWSKDGELYYIKKLTRKGKKAGSKRRLPFNNRDRHQIKYFGNDISLLGFHPEQNKFYKYQNLDKVLNEMRGESSLHFTSNTDWVLMNF